MNTEQRYQLFKAHQHEKMSCSVKVSIYFPASLKCEKTHRHVIAAVCTVQLPWRMRKENLLQAKEHLPLTEVPEELRELHFFNPYTCFGCFPAPGVPSSQHCSKRDTSSTLI